MSNVWWNYTVAGVEFPVDMLQHDRAWPKTDLDAMALCRSVSKGPSGDRREVKLQGLCKPHTKRWESFGWEVLYCQRGDL